MTANQWRLLDILDHWGGMGTIEVETQFGEYAPGTDAEDDMSGWNKTRLVVAGLMRSLTKKGLAKTHEGFSAEGCGYDITEKGRELLAKHKARVKGRQ